MIVNMALEQVPRTTEPNLPAILARSFDTMLRFSYRQALSLVATFCSDHDLPMSVASIPADPAGGNMLSFDTTVMRNIFDAAVERSQGPGLWRTPLVDASQPTDGSTA